MANPNSNYTNVITTTLEQRSKTLADNISNSNVILAELSRKGRVRPFSGGHKIIEPLMHTGQTASWFSGAETLSTADTDVITAAEYTIKELACPITMTGLEMAQNNGPEAVLDLYESKIQAAEASMANAIGTGLYSLGTESSGKTLVGLRLMVSNDGTGTVGGIAAGTYTFWANQYNSGTTTSASNVLSQLHTDWAEAARGADAPDVILMGSTIWGFYMGAVGALQQFVDSKTAAVGFPATKFMSADVYLDTTNPTATNAYLLNTRYLSLRPHRDYTMKPTPAIRSTSQDAEIVHLLWKGAITTSNRARQGVRVGA